VAASDGGVSTTAREALERAQSIAPPADASSTETRGALRTLAASRIFWVGLAIKVAASLAFGSHFATRWFAPFLSSFARHPFTDPWAAALARGEPLSFPYGPGMLAITSVPFLPAALFPIDPSGHVALLLLRAAPLAADVAIAALLVRWLRAHAGAALPLWWLNPVVFYATYVHGQLDLIPTALLCVTLELLFRRRFTAGAVLYGVTIATKAHVLLFASLLVLYLARKRGARGAWLRFCAVAAGTAVLLVAPLAAASPAFRTMVLGSPESNRLWAVAVPYGANGLVVYAAPAAILFLQLWFVTYRKINEDLTRMLIGIVSVGIVALVPPQPGWFVWSVPFLVCLAATERPGRVALHLLGAAYVVYVFFGAPEVFLEALDPTFGAGFGARAAAALVDAAPLVASERTASLAFTLLFVVTAFATFEMFHRGVASNSVYAFRSESFMIGIAGDSGTGKHTLAADLARLLGPSLTRVDGDDDHRWERGHAMWRSLTHLNPRANQLGRQLEGVLALRRGGDVRKPRYDHAEGRFTAPLLIRPTEIVAVVGLHPFYSPLQRQLLHLRVFTDPEEELRREWKIERDMAARGYTREQVVEQMDRREEDAARFVKPQRAHADLVLRHTAAEAGRPSAVSLALELTSDLDTLSLVDALERVHTLTVEWSPDEELTHDKVVVRGDVEPRHLRALAADLLPNADELLDAFDFEAGGRGVAQLALAYAISVRLRRA
jgi:uridine kinase